MRYYLFIFLASSSLFVHAQSPDSSLRNSPQLPGKYYSKVNKKISSINEQLTKKSLKYLVKFQRHERKLQQKIEKLNPGGATNVFANVNEKYKKFSEGIKSKSADPNKKMSGEYSPYLDSLSTSLTFLKQFNGISGKVKEPLASLNQLQSNLQQSEKIKEFIAERKNQIKELLSKYTRIPGSLKKEFDKLNKSIYYYSAQVKEYKELLNDPGKMEMKALSLLNQLPAFQRFMKENSALAGLFNLPAGYGNPQALVGLQTRDQVQQLITNQMGGGPNAGQLFGQQVQAARQELNQFKDKLSKLGGGSGDIEMPNFRPNGQKTKSFTKRLEYGFNVQFGRNNSMVPSSSDLALSVGYKVNNISVVGIGIGYKLGLGSLQHIEITNQGLELRGFLDYKVKKQFFISAGYEMNYNAAFKNIEQLKKYNAWQRSGLIGISKKYKVSKKVKGNIQLLYDFLARTHIPASKQLLFRMGYNF